MLRLILPMLTITLALAPAARAENVRERLALLEGDWTTEGQEKTFRETCSWFHERSHMVCTSESQTPEGVRRGVSVFSYSERTGRFSYFRYTSSGITAVNDIFIEGTTLRATSEREEGSDLVRSQVTMTQRPDGSFDFVEQESRNGGPWQPSATVHYIRRTAGDE